MTGTDGVSLCEVGGEAATLKGMSMNGRMNGRSVWVVGAMAMLVVGAMVFGGPITPPGGAIAPTGKTLDEIFNKIPAVGGADGRIPIPGGTSAVTISQPGSYVLTGNISVSGAANAILIAASDVTLDLNGFKVMQSNNTGPSTIFVNTAQANAVIRNGTVVGGNTAVTIGTNALGALIEDVSVWNARTFGIAVSTGTRGCVIRRCRVYDTGSTTTGTDGSQSVIGINVSTIGARVEDCTVSRLFYNGAGTATFRGIAMNASACAVIGCNVYQDAANPGIGILANGSVYRNNTVTNFTIPYTGGTDGGGNF